MIGFAGAAVALALSSQGCAPGVTPPDGATGVGTLSLITVETSTNAPPPFEVFEARSGVRVPGGFQPFVATPTPTNRTLTFVFRPTHPLKARTRYEIHYAGAMCVFACYDIPNAQVDGYDVVVNKPATSAYRAPGATNAAFAVETVID